MKGITFEREKKGYSIEQVEAYIEVLQENYKKVASSAQIAEDMVADLEQKLTDQKEKFEAANRQFEEERKTLKRRFIEQETQLKAAENTATAEQQQQLGQQQLKQQQLEQQIQELKQQMERQKAENSNLSQQIGQKEQEINRLRDQTAVEVEKSNWQEQINQLKEENHQLKTEVEARKDENNNEKNENMPEHLVELYTKAQEQADAYVEKIKQEMEAERDELAAERQAIITQAEADAQKIKETARQVKYDEFEEEKGLLRKEQEERLAEIAYLKQEAEAERTSAKEEAESIIRQAQLKLNLAEQKDKIRMEKAISKSRRVENQMEEQYQQMHSTLTDTAKRMAELFEYIANINEAKSIEEIRKYDEAVEKE